MGKKISAEYFAGLIDGEGCLMMYEGKKQSRFEIGIGMCSSIIMPIIKENFNGCLYEVKRRTKKGKTVWHWRTSGKNAYTVLKQISPFLLEKKEQAEIMIKFWEDFKLEKSVRYYSYIARSNDQILNEEYMKYKDAQKQLCQQLKGLKQGTQYFGGVN